MFEKDPAWLRGKCSTCNQRELGLSITGSAGFFMRVALGKTFHSPNPVLVNPGTMI